MRIISNVITYIFKPTQFKSLNGLERTAVIGVSIVSLALFIIPAPFVFRGMVSVLFNRKFKANPPGKTQSDVSNVAGRIINTPNEKRNLANFDRSRSRSIFSSSSSESSSSSDDDLDSAVSKNTQKIPETATAQQSLQTGTADHKPSSKADKEKDAEDLTDGDSNNSTRDNSENTPEMPKPVARHNLQSSTVNHKVSDTIDEKQDTEDLTDGDSSSSKRDDSENTQEMPETPAQSLQNSTMDHQQPLPKATNKEKDAEDLSGGDSSSSKRDDSENTPEMPEPPAQSLQNSPVDHKQPLPKATNKEKDTEDLSGGDSSSSKRDDSENTPEIPEPPAQSLQNSPVDHKQPLPKATNKEKDAEDLSGGDSSSSKRDDSENTQEVLEAPVQGLQSSTVATPQNLVLTTNSSARIASPEVPLQIPTSVHVNSTSDNPQIPSQDQLSQEQSNVNSTSTSVPVVDPIVSSQDVPKLVPYLSPEISYEMKRIRKEFKGKIFNESQEKEILAQEESLNKGDFFLVVCANEESEFFIELIYKMRDPSVNDDGLESIFLNLDKNTIKGIKKFEQQKNNIGNEIHKIFEENIIDEKKIYEQRIRKEFKGKFFNESQEEEILAQEESLNKGDFFLVLCLDANEESELVDAEEKSELVGADENSEYFIELVYKMRDSSLNDDGLESIFLNLDKNTIKEIEKLEQQKHNVRNEIRKTFEGKIYRIDEGKIYQLDSDEPVAEIVLQRDNFAILENDKEYILHYCTEKNTELSTFTLHFTTLTEIQEKLHSLKLKNRILENAADFDSNALAVNDFVLIRQGSEFVVKYKLLDGTFYEKSIAENFNNLMLEDIDAMIRKAEKSYKKRLAKKEIIAQLNEKYHFVPSYDEDGLRKNGYQVGVKYEKTKDIPTYLRLYYLKENESFYKKISIDEYADSKIAKLKTKYGIKESHTTTKVPIAETSSILEVDKGSNIDEELEIPHEDLKTTEEIETLSILEAEIDSGEKEKISDTPEYKELAKQCRYLVNTAAYRSISQELFEQTFDAAIRFSLKYYNMQDKLHRKSNFDDSYSDLENQIDYFQKIFPCMMEILISMPSHDDELKNFEVWKPNSKSAQILGKKIYKIHIDGEIRRIVCMNIMGMGSFNKVYAASDMLKGKLRALRMPTGDGEGKQDEEYKIHQLLRKIDSIKNYIIKLHAVEDKIALLSFADTLVNEKANLSAMDRADSLKQMFIFLTRLHTEGFIFGDLKLDNLLYKRTETGRIQVKFADFSEAHHETQNQEVFLCHPFYRTPEMLYANGGLSSKASDAWMLANVMFELKYITASSCFSNNSLTKHFVEDVRSWSLQQRADKILELVNSPERFLNMESEYDKIIAYIFQNYTEENVLKKALVKLAHLQTSDFDR